jgi:hypothetical protein
MLQQGQQKQRPLGKTKTTNQNLPGKKKKKKKQSPENREKNRTMKNSLSVIDKQIKENRSKIALTTSATEEEEERRAKHKAGNTRAREHQYQRQTRERGERIEIAHFRVNAHQHRPKSSSPTLLQQQNPKPAHIQVS